MILFLSTHDYSNFSHDMAKALRTTGLHVVDVKTEPHKFDYAEESPVLAMSNILGLIEKADQVHIMHSEPNLLKTIIAKTKQKNIIVWHTGTRYRQDPAKFNALFNPHVNMSILALGEFWDLGAKNQQYMVGAIDTDRLTYENPYTGGTPKIYHLPSSPKVKGTEKIIKMMSTIEGDYNFQYKLDSCDYDQQIALMQECDVYIELFANTQDGKPYGSFGITALEAAAMGKVVITQHNSDSVYQNEYGITTPFETSPEEFYFKNSIQTLVRAPSIITTLQKRTREWVVDNHSYAATGARLRKLLKL